MIPSVSLKTLQNAKKLENNDLLSAHYSPGFKREKATPEELQFIRSFFLLTSKVAPPQARNGTVQLTRGDDSTRVAKFIQCRPDTDMYQLYRLAWIESGHSSPRSKAFLIQHR